MLPEIPRGLERIPMLFFLIVVGAAPSVGQWVALFSQVLYPALLCGLVREQVAVRISGRMPDALRLIVGDLFEDGEARLHTSTLEVEQPLFFCRGSRRTVSNIRHTLPHVGVEPLYWIFGDPDIADSVFAWTQQTVNVNRLFHRGIVPRNVVYRVVNVV